jgi:hypothetical protein
MATWLYGPFAFIITFAENWVSSRERFAERQSKLSKTRRFSLISASWSSVFEIILLVDIVLTVADPLAIAPWVLVGGWLGQYLACEKQRRKFQSRVRRKRKVLPSAVTESLCVEPAALGCHSPQPSTEMEPARVDVVSMGSAR